MAKTIIITEKQLELLVFKLHNKITENKVVKPVIKKNKKNNF
jgi:hypothetical protein